MLLVVAALVGQSVSPSVTVAVEKGTVTATVPRPAKGRTVTTITVIPVFAEEPPLTPRTLTRRNGDVVITFDRPHHDFWMDIMLDNGTSYRFDSAGRPVSYILTPITRGCAERLVADEEHVVHLPTGSVI